MSESTPEWQIQPAVDLPASTLEIIQPYLPQKGGKFLAQLLAQRGLVDPAQLPGFLDPAHYQPTSPFAFGAEMEQAIARIQTALTQQEVVAIWGDFDADGVTATAVLWDGLGTFFQPQTTLFYYIPNRLTESHGLSKTGLQQLEAKKCRLVITCDTGSTNLDEIDYAHQLGMDVIITDHHILPVGRPPVTAILNPRYFPAEHPLATLSGVAVAYKLVEAVYQRLPGAPEQPPNHLLDLVAIGLIADLVELRGDSRYLAQRGIEQLQKQGNPATATRPGITRLLQLCKRSGDRPTDIAFGLGPRINAVSRLQGDAHFCVELLTSQDPHLCNHLAEATELANARRKALQADVTKQVLARLAQMDLSTTSVIVLSDDQWHPGVLGLVAGQIAQEYGRPSILLSTGQGQDGPSAAQPLARGSARSANGIDLYQLVAEQTHLLHRFGGHPCAAGLSLPIENLPLFTQAINQRSRQLIEQVGPCLTIDLTVTVTDLGQHLFQELKLLEPCGMGNPVPKLLIRNCWFEDSNHRRIKDWKGRQVQYIKTEFKLWDETVTRGFAGSWWGHYKDDLPAGRCDVVVELDFNAYQRDYEVRLIALRPAEAASDPLRVNRLPLLLDWRNSRPSDQISSMSQPLVMHQCPSSWAELQAWCRRARREQRPLAIAYPLPVQSTPAQVWLQLAGIAKYLSRTQKTVTRQQLLDKLGIGDRPLQSGFRALQNLGFTLHIQGREIGMQWQPATALTDRAIAQTVDGTGRSEVVQFLAGIQEEQFRRQYFYQVSVERIQAIMAQVNSEYPNIPDKELT